MNKICASAMLLRTRLGWHVLVLFWLRCTENLILLQCGKYYKYLSCVYGVDRKICHEGH